MEKKAFYAIFAVATLIFLCGNGTMAAAVNPETTRAMKLIGASKGDRNLLVLTNAPYVNVNGTCALVHLEAVQEATGCSVGRGNLLFFQRPQDHPLRIMLFKKTTGDAVIISLTDGSPVSEPLNLSAEVISEAAFWKRTDSLTAGKDMFTLAAIANAWAAGAPYDFLKSAELHNHICPGLTSGYLMAHYIRRSYPLQEGERYIVVACPVWCKEDALQVVLDCTPGKRGLVVKPLSKEQEEAISVKNPAGMLLIWDREKKRGKGVALSFDFDNLRKLSPEGTPKAAMVMDAIAHLGTPEKFVSTAAEFPLTEALYHSIVNAGGNPYVLAGLIK